MEITNLYRTYIKKDERQPWLGNVSEKFASGFKNINRELKTYTPVERRAAAVGSAVYTHTVRIPTRATFIRTKSGHIFLPSPSCSSYTKNTRSYNNIFNGLRCRERFHTATVILRYITFHTLSSHRMKINFPNKFGTIMMFL